MKPFLTDKGLSQQNIIIVENEEIISEEKEVAKKLNTFFNNAVKSLGISENPFILNSHYSDDSIESILK